MLTHNTMIAALKLVCLLSACAGALIRLIQPVPWQISESGLNFHQCTVRRHFPSIVVLTCDVTIELCEFKGLEPVTVLYWTPWAGPALDWA